MIGDFTDAQSTLFERVVITSPLTVSPATAVSETIAKMHQARSSYAVIVEQPPASQPSKQRLVGLFTERELVRAVASEQSLAKHSFDESPITSVMARQMPTVLKRNVTSAINLFVQMRQQDLRYLPVVDDSGYIAGLITQDSIIQALDSENSQKVVALLQHEVMQLRAENRILLEARNPELEQAQLDLDGQLKNRRREQQSTKKDLEAAYDALERSHNALSVTNQELQSTKRRLQQINAELEGQVERRTSDLRQAESRWRSLLEEVHLVVIGLDLDGKVNYANPFFLWLTGYSAEEVIEKYWFDDFIPEAEYEQTYEYFQTFVNNRELPLRYQNAILTRSGSERIIAWNNVAMRDRTNRIIGTMSIGEDITDRLVVDRMKGEFVSVVSHELRTPLTAIHGGLNLITSGLVASDSQTGKDLLQVAADSSERLVRLVNDILELERLESGKAQINQAEVNSQTLTAQAVRTFQVVASSKEITIEIHDPGLILMVDCDRLMQVLTNLLDNAIKFSPNNTTIELSVERRHPSRQKPKALFKVKDEGRGIPSEDLLEIFERFTQINYADSREMGGTGLGLAICHNIIRQHGGEIWVESRLGTGSCFFFTVPLSTQ
jgi:PAS domain S-box-containing protein